jgi:quercetin dioxygenase-like cupin family protein
MKIESHQSPFQAYIADLPQADIPVEGVKGYISQAQDHQIVFMEFDRDCDIPPHSHGEQWGTVIRGEIHLTIAGKEHQLRAGDTYYIPAQVEHSAKIFAGYADVSYFGERDRWKVV